MAEDALVMPDVEAGAALVKALDQANFPTVAAFWMHYPEAETWKLVLATAKATTPQETYIEIRHIAEKAKLESPDLAQIKLVRPDDPTVATLSRVIRIEDLGSVRFSQNMINGIYVDDAYIYRMAA